MSYSIESNRCEGWHRPIFSDRNGSKHYGAKWPTYREAYDAVVFHYKNGKFLSEVEEKSIEICSHCGQPMPEGE